MAACQTKLLFGFLDCGILVTGETAMFQFEQSAPQNPETSQIRSFGRTLHRRPAVVINVYDERFGIGGQVATRLDGDLGQLFQTGFLAFSSFRKWSKFTRNSRDLIEFALLKLYGRPGERCDDGFDQTLQRVVEVVVFGVTFFVREFVGLHVPDELVGGQLPFLGKDFDEFYHASHIVVANSLHKLGDVKKDSIWWIRVEASNG